MGADALNKWQESWMTARNVLSQPSRVFVPPPTVQDLLRQGVSSEEALRSLVSVWVSWRVPDAAPDAERLTAEAAVRMWGLGAQARDAENSLREMLRAVSDRVTQLLESGVGDDRVVYTALFSQVREGVLPTGYNPTNRDFTRDANRSMFFGLLSDLRGDLRSEGVKRILPAADCYQTETGPAVCLGGYFARDPQDKRRVRPWLLADSVRQLTTTVRKVQKAKEADDAYRLRVEEAEKRRKWFESPLGQRLAENRQLLKMIEEGTIPYEPDPATEKPRLIAERPASRDGSLSAEAEERARLQAEAEAHAARRHAEQVRQAEEARKQAEAKRALAATAEQKPSLPPPTDEAKWAVRMVIVNRQDEPVEVRDSLYEGTSRRDAQAVLRDFKEVERYIDGTTRTRKTLPGSVSMPDGETLSPVLVMYRNEQVVEVLRGRG
jgi:hypothetical protein